MSKKASQFQKKVMSLGYRGKEMSARIAMVYAECTRGKKTENVELL